jgi:alpha-beta hydrolase superfamily lysophospholipase
MEDQDIDFGDRSLTVSKDGGKFEYFYAEPTVIVAPEAGKNIPVEAHFEFDMTKADIEMINKAAAITTAKNVILKSVQGQVTLTIGDSAVANSNSYTRTVGSSEHSFNCILPVERLKLIPDAYHITLSKLKFLHFKSTSRDMAYWLALEPASEV